MVIGGLGEFRDDLAAVLEPFLRLVLRVADPVRCGIEGAGLRDDIGRAETPCMTDDGAEVVQALLPLSRIGMDDIGVAGNRADWQVVVAEGLPHALGLLRRDRIRRREIDVLEGEIELNRVESDRLDPLRLFFQCVGEVSVEDANLKHMFSPPVLLFLFGRQSSNSASFTVRCSATDR
jgi:hypothetical protein